MTAWCFPIPFERWTGPNGRFGAVRKHDVHTGVDIYCQPGERVFAVEDGEVVAVVPFTGPQAQSQWWHPTDAVLVQGESGVVCYGEVNPAVSVGERVRRGNAVGSVLTVLKQDKGLPMTMLHLELYESGTTEPCWWRSGDPRPKGLLDPTPWLLESLLTRARDNS